ncbi:MAG: hypothetical protein HY697_02720 [Deltaproteobacteria bacterium]|nr:hypothetical protein [Deltaproteobacteria bacterium]
MKKILFYLLTISLVCIPWGAIAGSPVRIEILYMNHGPLQDSIEGIKKVLSGYNGKVTVSWYDFDSKRRRSVHDQERDKTAYPPGHLDGQPG